MDVLFANPLAAGTPGPAFLMIYAIVAVAIVVIARIQIDAADAGSKALPAAVTVDRDPYEIAYLRGGPNELLRFAVFDLIHRGFLAIVPDAQTGVKKKKTALASVVATGAAGRESLSAFAAAIVDFYATPQTAKELFASPLPAAAVAYGKQTMEPRMQTEGIFTSDAVRAVAVRMRTLGAIALVLLTGYRMAYAVLVHHAAFLFLILETLLALFVLWRATITPRLSRYGRSYLGRLATAVRPNVSAPVGAGAVVLPLLVAATGFGALAGTEYAPAGTLFPQAANDRQSGMMTSGCGTPIVDSSGSSSSCSSGGCGGGCGG